MLLPSTSVLLSLIPLIVAQGKNPNSGPGNGKGPPTDPPTPSPTPLPSASPTLNPTSSPTSSPTSAPTVSISACTVLDSIYWFNTNSPECSLPCCEFDAGTYRFPYTQQVTEQLTLRIIPTAVQLEFPLLETVGRFWISDNPNLVGISVPNLSSATSVEIERNDAIASLGFSSLTSVSAEDSDANFEVRSNDALTSLQVPSLSTLHAGGIDWDYYNANLFIWNCPLLTDIIFDNLVEVTAATGEANLFLFNNEKVTTVSFPQLERVVGGEEAYGAVSISNQNVPDDVLQAIEFPELVEIVPSEYSEFSVTYTRKMTNLELPKLAIAPTMFYRSLPSLVELRLPKWDEANYLYFYPGSCTGTNEVRVWLCSLDTVGDGLYFSEDCYRVKGTDTAEAICDEDTLCQTFQTTPPVCR